MYYPPIIELIRKEDYLIDPLKYIPLNGDPINEELYPREALEALKIPFKEQQTVKEFNPLKPVNDVYTVISSPPKPNPVNGQLGLAQFAFQPIQTDTLLIDSGKQFLSVEAPGRPVYIGMVFKPDMPERILTGIKIVPKMPASASTLDTHGSLKHAIVVPTVYQIFGTHDDAGTVKDGDLKNVRWESIVDPTRIAPEEWEFGAITSFEFPSEHHEELRYKGFKLVVHEWDYSNAPLLDTDPGFYRVEFLFKEENHVVETLSIPAPDGYIYVVNMRGITVSEHLARTEKLITPDIDVDKLARVLVNDPHIAQKYNELINDGLANMRDELGSTTDLFQNRYTELKETVAGQLSGINDTATKAFSIVNDLREKINSLDQHTPIESTPVTVDTESLTDEVKSRLDAAKYDLFEQFKEEVKKHCATELYHLDQEKQNSITNLNERTEHSKTLLDKHLTDLKESMDGIITEQISKIMDHKLSEIETELERAKVSMMDEVKTFIVNTVKEQISNVPTNVETNTVSGAMASYLENKIDVLSQDIRDLNEHHGVIVITDAVNSFNPGSNEMVDTWYLFSKGEFSPNKEVEIDLANISTINQRFTLYNYSTEALKIRIRSTDRINLICNKQIHVTNNFALTDFNESVNLIYYDGQWYGNLIEG